MVGFFAKSSRFLLAIGLLSVVVGVSVAIGGDASAATVPAAGPCTTTVIAPASIQAEVDSNSGAETICLNGTFNQNVTIGPEDTADGAIVIQEAPAATAIMDGTGLPGYNDAFTLNPGVSNVTIRDLEIRNYVDSGASGGTGNAISAWGPYGAGPATSNVNVWNNNMHDFGWNAVLVGNSGRALHDNWSVIGNTISGNGWVGVELTNTSNSLISDNTIANNGVSDLGVCWAIGIMLQGRNYASEGGAGSVNATNITVTNNTITNLGTCARPATYGEYGIYVTSQGDSPAAAALSNVTIGAGNRIENNSRYGVSVNAAGGSVTGVDIATSDLLNNGTAADGGAAIRVSETAPGVTSAITAHFNNITGNADYGARNTAAAAFDATCNWWGASNGPGPVGPGSGDTVTANVTYDPWLPSSGAACGAGQPGSVGGIAGLLDSGVAPAPADSGELASSSQPFSTVALGGGVAALIAAASAAGWYARRRLLN